MEWFFYHRNHSEDPPGHLLVLPCSVTNKVKLQQPNRGRSDSGSHTSGMKFWVSLTHKEPNKPRCLLKIKGI